MVGGIKDRLHGHIVVKKNLLLKRIKGYNLLMSQGFVTNPNLSLLEYFFYVARHTRRLGLLINSSWPIR